MRRLTPTAGGATARGGPSRVSRRRFLRSGALTTVGLAGAGLIGCGDDDDGAASAGNGTGTPSGASPAGTAAGAPPGGGLDGEIGTADVLGSWDEALPRFEALVEPWEQETGGQVEFTGTREPAALLTTRVEGNNPPDIALAEDVGLVRQFARAGLLVPLSECGIEQVVQDNYPAAFTDLTTVDGEPYGFFVGAETSGTIWYNPRVFHQRGWEPLTADDRFEDLLALSRQIADDGFTPWSIGVEDGRDSGRPGADWIQQILLNEAGPEVYDGVVDGSLPFTDGAMRSAWEHFGEIALTEGWTVQGSGAAINATSVVDACYPPFQGDPQAAMVYHGPSAAGIIEERFPGAVPGDYFDFFPFPGGGVTGSASVVYAFNSSETTCSLLEHLASAAAQQVWVEAGGFVSLHRGVSLDAYPDPVAHRRAEQLTSAEVFRYNLGDALGGEVRQTFFTAVTEFLQDPDRLDALLEQIEEARI